MNNTPGTDPSTRQYDVIVHGASGFTGALVARYLLQQYGLDGDLRWAISGRDKQKLEQLREQLGPQATSLEIIVADSFDKTALNALARQTRVVLTTVGPYAIYGSDLVAACVSAGTHYCDLAGEVQWVRKMIDEHHQAAKKTGARIVHCCGFDSVPMDIGVWALQEACKEKYGEYCQSISLFVKATKGTASGGTLASMMNLIKESRADREVARILVRPYSLNPEGEQDGPDKRDQQGVVFRDDANSWTAPFAMAGVNTKVVRRSHALRDYPYGKDFRYDESTLTGRGARGWLKGSIMTLAIAALVIGASFKPTRALLEKFVLAKPGEGPSPELQKTGFFNLMQIGKLPNGHVVRGRITGDQDPGYGSTSKMLSECAVCLARDELQSSGGVLTPVAAMAEPLLQRLRDNAGLTFAMLD